MAAVKFVTDLRNCTGILPWSLYTISLVQLNYPGSEKCKAARVGKLSLRKLSLGLLHAFAGTVLSEQSYLSCNCENRLAWPFQHHRHRR